MTDLMVILINISFVGLLAISISRYIKYRNNRNLIIHLLIISSCYAFFRFLFYESSDITLKGEEDNSLYFAIVLYLCMIIGMFSHYAYTRFTKPKDKRPSFDLGLFLAPFFTSPIIFIPLLASLQNANIDLQNLTTTKIMVFIVAFENGFFWKEYFNNRRKGEKNVS